MKAGPRRFAMIIKSSQSLSDRDVPLGINQEKGKWDGDGKGWTKQRDQDLGKLLRNNKRFKSKWSLDRIMEFKEGNGQQLECLDS